ncbi:MAG: hypothetical protein HDS65_02625 [Bacteroidales bacterium]|nr:hypothetical protein [Bacteroidales bacterium]
MAETTPTPPTSPTTPKPISPLRDIYPHTSHTPPHYVGVQRAPIYGSINAGTRSGYRFT